MRKALDNRAFFCYYGYNVKQDDLIIQVRRLIGTVNSVLERYSRVSEEYDSNRLATEEIRELLKELIEEVSTWAQYIGSRMDRQEEYVILVGMGKGKSHQAQAITQVVSQEHIERGLREELVAQQKLLQTYQRNLAKIKQQIAEMGYTSIENGNKEDEYQYKIDRATEAISRIREALNG